MFAQQGCRHGLARAWRAVEQRPITRFELMRQFPIVEEGIVVDEPDQDIFDLFLCRVRQDEVFPIHARGHVGRWKFRAENGPGHSAKRNLFYQFPI